MTALTIVFTVLAALIFLAAAWVKFSEEPSAMATRDALAIAPSHYQLIGVAEVAGSLGALVGLGLRPLGILSLAGLVLVALGACAANYRLHKPWSEARVGVIALVVAALALVLQIATA